MSEGSSPGRMLVVDANILVYSLLGADERLSPLATQLAHRHPFWMLPPIWEHEFANTLVGYVRRGDLDEVRMATVMEKALLRFSVTTQAVPMDRVLRTALRGSLTVYDAQYLALAEALECSLVTEDKALRLRSGGRAISLREALDLPGGFAVEERLKPYPKKRKR
jgi:predicted nucleic acid-binding protein